MSAKTTDGWFAFVRTNSTVPFRLAAFIRFNPANSFTQETADQVIRVKRCIFVARPFADRLNAERVHGLLADPSNTAPVPHARVDGSFLHANSEKSRGTVPEANQSPCRTLDDEQTRWPPFRHG